MLREMVNESTTHVFVPENALAGPIPTEIGLLTNLAGSVFSPGLSLSNNQLTGTLRQ